MKIWKLALAVLLAVGVVVTYLNFPNPLEQAGRDQAKEQAAKAPAESPAAEPPAAENPAAEST